MLQSNSNHHQQQNSNNNFYYYPNDDLLTPNVIMTLRPLTIKSKKTATMMTNNNSNKMMMSQRCSNNNNQNYDGVYTELYNSLVLQTKIDVNNNNKMLQQHPHHQSPLLLIQHYIKKQIFSIICPSNKTASSSSSSTSKLPSSSSFSSSSPVVGSKWPFTSPGRSSLFTLLSHTLNNSNNNNEIESHNHLIHSNYHRKPLHHHHTNLQYNYDHIPKQHHSHHQSLLSKHRQYQQQRRPPHRTTTDDNFNQLIWFLFTAIFFLLTISRISLIRCDPSPSSSSSSSSSLSAPSIPANAQPLTSINFRCPEQFGYYADEYNCSKYFVCVFGEALHESCTGGLRFSSELQTCDWPRNVVCPFEDSDYDDTDETDFDSGADLTRPNHSVKHQNQPQQVGSGMIIESGHSSSSSSSSINGGYVSEHPFVHKTHKLLTQNAPPPPPSSSSGAIFNKSDTFRSANSNNNGNNVNYHSPQQQHHYGVVTPPPTIVNNQNTIIYHYNNNPGADPVEIKPSGGVGVGINEQTIIQDSYDKLVKQQQQQPKGRQLHPQSIPPVQNNYLDISGNDLITVNGNRLDFGNLNGSIVIGNHRHNNNNHHNSHHSSVGSHQRPPSHHNRNVDDDLEENYTLVDLQRARHHSQPSLPPLPPPPPPHKTPVTTTILRNEPILNENILGTIGRSVNGENRAQSVSVVASTSSKAIIPELDFVFKNRNHNDEKIGIIADKPASTAKVTPNTSDKHLENSNRLLIDEILQLTNAFSNDNADGKFDDVITAIVDENGAIHLAGGTDPSTLLRILSGSGKNELFDKPEELAASNRNTAAQQLLVSNVDGEKFKYLTSQTETGNKLPPQSNKSLVDNVVLPPAPPPTTVNFESLEPGAILVYNKTQLVVVPETTNQQPQHTQPTPSPVVAGDNNKPKTTIPATNQTLILIDSIPGKSEGGLSDTTGGFISEQDQNLDSNKPRQLITRTDKESSFLYSQNFQNQNKTSSHIGSKDRTTTGVNQKIIPKTVPNYYSTPPTLTIDEGDDDGIRIMVNIPQAQAGIIKDFQRLANRTDSDLHKRRVSDYRPAVQRLTPSTSANSTQQQQQQSSSTSTRLSHVRHLGSHHRITSPKSNSTWTNSSRTVKNLQIASRPASLFKTPEPFSPAIKCSEHLCKLPDCFCGGTEIPGGLGVKDVPQLVLISFDDAVNDINWHIYEELLNSGRSNPNGCPIKATFYVSHEWTDYSQVQTLYSRGHEIASHSITHSFGESYTKQQWHKEIVGQREILHLYGGVNKADIRGMRAPFLQGGGNKQFEMLHEENFTYDSSMPVFENSPPFWPYTLDYAINHECMIAPCPTKSFPGLWEIGLVMWQDLRGGRCSMGDACSNPSDADGVYELIMKNFKRHYNSNRAPFGLYYHSAWFNSEHHRKGFIRVIDDLLTYYKDVYFVTKWELIQWIRNPTPLKELYRVNLFGCARDPHRPPPCLHPNICNVGSNSGARFLKTCQPCPKRYPWLDDTGQ